MANIEAGKEQSSSNFYSKFKEIECSLRDIYKAGPMRKILSPLNSEITFRKRIFHLGSCGKFTLTLVQECHEVIRYKNS